jgi:alkanesulfonate monooxygenase SsuD/methylene tetrahydromethanopterin reductase-like flavin-dependent oxidoreductase (luciferase family)
VAETDQQAIDEAREHIENLFNVFLPKASELMFFPPGYMSIQSLKQVLQNKRSNAGGVKIETLIERGIILCGSPSTVTKHITDAHAELGFQELLGMFQFGTLPGSLTEKNLRLFASEVLPNIRGLTDKEYRGFNAKEHAAAQA